jgi:hypothetical protein
MSFQSGAWRLAALLGVAVVAVACGSGASQGSASPSGAGGRTPEPGATSTPGATPATATGAPGVAQATVKIGDAEHVISGGTCGAYEFPPDFGGGYGFSLNIGRMNFEDGGPDYLGVLIDVPGMGDAADGTYESTWNNATGTLVAGSTYTRLGDIVLTVANGATEGTLTSVVRDEGTPVEIAFTC